MPAQSLHKIGILILIFLNVACDQWSKTYVEKNVEASSYTELAGPAFILTNVKNTGAFLGLGQDWSTGVKRVLLNGLPLLLLLYLTYRLLFSTAWKSWLLVGFSFILGGGIGNILDRLRFGAVTDFFQLRAGPVHTGIFNMADVSVSVGLVLILIGYWLNKKTESQ